jgi:hypothetical protein
LQALFPGAGPGFSGYVALESDLGVVGYQSRRGAQSVFSLPAQPQSGARELFSAQFASGPVGGIRYFTELNLINTAAAPRLAQISLIGEDGIRIAGPVTYALNAGEAKLVRGETVFGLQNPALATVLTEGTLEVRADGDGILGDVTFGDAAAGRFISALPLDGAPLADMILSQVAEGSQDAGRAYFTGIAMYNPNASDVDVAVNVFSEDGVPTGAGSLVLRSGRRIAQTLSELVPGFPGQMRGYVRITASGGPVIAYEVFGNASADFLAAVPPQGIAR